MEIQKVAGDFIAARSQIDKIVTAAKGLLCLPSILFTFANPQNLLKGIGLIAGAVGNAVANAVLDTIQDRVQDLISTAILPLKLLQGYVKSLQNTLSNVQQLLKNLDKKSKNLNLFMKNTQNCAVQAANFMNCIATAIANKITKNILPKLNSQFDRLQRDIASETYRAGGLMEQHVGREVRSAERLTKQLAMMTR